MAHGIPRFRHVVGRARRAVHERRATPGVERVDIRALIAPLRYDVAIRADFFDYLADHAELAGDDLVEAAGGTAYAAWFEHVECARYFPALHHDKDLRRERFAARVAGAVRLFRSFENTGFDSAHPVTLISAPAGSVSDSGAPALGDLHIGDGCHRLALLLRQGALLEPSMYRVRSLLTPLVDNTAVLVRQGVLGQAEYVEHLASRLPIGDAKTVVDAIANVGSSADPAHAEILKAVLDAQWHPATG